jgi:hypothetical protein
VKNNVIFMDVITEEDIPVDRVLEQAIGELDTVVICGREKNTGELYFASNTASGPKALWLVEKFKKMLLEL